MVNKHLKWGVMIGLCTIAIRLGIINVTEEIRQSAYTFGYSMMSLSVFAQASKYIKQLPKLSPKVVNIVTGFALSSSVVSFALYGIDFF